MTISLAEELVLLAYNDDGAPQGTSTWMDYGIAGAHLVELALTERIEVRDGTVTVVDTTPTGAASVDAALVTIAADTKQRKPKDWIYRLSKRARGPVLDGLVEAGVLERREDRVMRIFPVTRYPSPDGTPPAAEVERRRLMREALENPADADARTMALCTLVEALDWVKPVFPDLPQRETKKRLKELGEAHWAGIAVGAFIKDIQVALIMTAVIATTAAS
ncbi:GOLPH3/VPS74 family protein [Catenuloplanes japonicus]|uniref:GOLPH3/VPS74 family protein n=1 Tax=Catenuloplanes japonicus TaxID=33876 RepID=UPI0005248D2A|nr:GPP34 family phosphoprotein [Catenuloplanes japonicus]